MTRRGAAAGVALLCALWTALPVAAQTGWVKDEVALNLRSGPGLKYRILGGVKTGDRLEIRERGEKWTQVRTSGGKEGWIPAGFLQGEPPAKVRLEQAELEAARLRGELAGSEAETGRLRSANAELVEDDAEQRRQLEHLTKENSKLRAGERWAEWITGALILSTGMVLGAILSRLSQRRSRTRLRL